jgi:lipopolysaccharide heptosyltransferase II
MLNKEEIFHIALWMPSWIGDVVLSLPALESLRKLYPNARITAIAKFPTDQLLNNRSIVDSVIKFPKKKGDNYLKQYKYARGLRKYKFDLGIVFSNSFHSALMLMLMGPRFRIGYRTDWRQIFLTHSIPVTLKEKKTLHRVKYFHKILSPLNSVSLPDCYDSRWTKGSSVKLKNILSEVGVSKKDIVITIHPGASKIERAWHAERFGILCQNLIKAYSVKILLLGTSEENLLLKTISSYCPSGNITIAVKFKIFEIVQLLKSSHLFIGNDSGLLHLASLVDTPVVGIFGPGQAATTGPFINITKQEIVTRNYPCSPCNQRFFKECEPSLHQKPECIESISVKNVSDAVQKIVKRLKLF